MNSSDPLPDYAAELIDAARAFHAAAGQPGQGSAAPLALAGTEEALQLLSASWYQLAADAVPGIAQRSRGHRSGRPAPNANGLSHEQEVGLMAAFHDVAAALAHCARISREARVVIGRRSHQMGVSAGPKSVFGPMGDKAAKGED